MSVLTCKIMDDHRASENEKALRFTEMYRIITTGDSDTPASILEDSNENIPRVGDPHPVNATVTVKERRVRFTGARNVYVLEVNYDNAAPEGGGGGGGGGGGTIDVLEVTLTNWWEDYILEYVLDGQGKKKRIANSADDPIKYEARRPHPMITFTAVTQDPFLANIVRGVGSVNTNPIAWLGILFEEEQLLFDSYDATSIGGNNWRETFVFKSKLVFAPDYYGNEGKDRFAGWQPWLLDAGLWEWVDEDGVQVRRPIYATQKEGDKKPTKPVTEPWPLDGVGKALARDDIKEKRVFEKWDVYPTFDFNVDFGARFDFTKILTEDKRNELGI